jgi:hypothetical protein
MNKTILAMTIGAILATATAIAQLHLMLAIVGLVIGTCLAGATALAKLWGSNSRKIRPKHPSS